MAPVVLRWLPTAFGDAALGRPRQTKVLDRNLADPEMAVLAGGVVIYEVLAGFDHQAKSSATGSSSRTLSSYRCSTSLFCHAHVANYQTLRQHGTALGTVEMSIATYCIEAGAELLTANGDFAPMRDDLGLQLVA